MTNKKKILIILTVLIAITIGNIKSYANTGSNIIKKDLETKMEDEENEYEE